MAFFVNYNNSTILKQIKNNGRKKELESNRTKKKKQNHDCIWNITFQKAEIFQYKEVQKKCIFA